MTLRILEESTQWANRAELYIGLFKESIRKDLSKSNSPIDGGGTMEEGGGRMMFGVNIRRRVLVTMLMPMMMGRTMIRASVMMSMGLNPPFTPKANLVTVPTGIV